MSTSRPTSNTHTDTHTHTHTAEAAAVHVLCTACEYAATKARETMLALVTTSCAMILAKGLACDKQRQYQWRLCPGLGPSRETAQQSTPRLDYIPC